MKTVIAFGTFDILHPGHVKFLKAAQRLGGRLTVVVTRDERVRSEKGRAPVMNEQERLALVSSLKPVDRAVLGDRVGEWRILNSLYPDIIAVGYDQRMPPQRQKIKGKTKIVRLPRLSGKRHKSSLIKKRITSYAH